MATFLICKTIYTHTTHNLSARKRLSHVVDSLIQSCGMYTVISVMQAIANLSLKANTGYYVNNSTTLTLSGFGNYSTSLSSATSSLIPTLMIARLAVAPPLTDSINIEPTSLVPSKLMKPNRQAKRLNKTIAG
ncbi:hypothetical protein CPC08DRAFT_716060 [Agrocybe pediades]|nr:hypothetical protein CPC08DRAFT_716060 [Agrocybe pediades]